MAWDADSLYEEEANQEEADQQEADQQEKAVRAGISGKPQKINTPLEASYIAGVIEDFSRQLGDAIHSVVHIRHALRLWAESGRSAEHFVTAYLYPAKTRTQRLYGSSGAGGIQRMASFFESVQALLEQNSSA